jgi:membrane-bound lytic murein transglycosylase D
MKKIIIALVSLSSLSLAEAKDHRTDLSLVRFCGEPMPIQNPHVINLFQQSIRRVSASAIEAMKPEALKLFKVVEPILKKYKIPSDFKYLAIVESSMMLDAVSSKGARGYWQFMPITARSLGLRVDGNVDERLHVLKSTHAACRYFRTMYRQLGSWTLVAAAYNIGPTKVALKAEESEDTDYYDWSLSAENRRYIYKVMAMKELFTRPEAYQKVLKRQIDLQTLFKKYGPVFGLVAPTPVRYYPSILHCKASVSASIVNGFQDIVPVVFKRKSMARTYHIFERETITQKPKAIIKTSDFQRYSFVFRSILSAPLRQRRKTTELMVAKLSSNRKTSKLVA